MTTQTKCHTRDTRPVYRLHINTACDDRAASFRFCLDNGVIGMGWGIGDEDLSWTAYVEEREAQGGTVDSSVRRLHDLPMGALVWLRDQRGAYYIAEITGEWKYMHGPAADRVDIHNVRPARIYAAGTESMVPGKVLNSFIPSRTLQSISDDAAARFTASLFDTLAGKSSDWVATREEVLRSCLSARDLEDLVSAYLQCEKGYMVLPASWRPDTPAYEYVLHHRDGHDAVVQVKGGWSTVPRDAASLPVELVERVYVFSPTGSYGPDAAPNVATIKLDEIVEFMKANLQSLPPTVQHWVTSSVAE